MAYERSAHEKKYDRQMRLWGSHGQRHLETSHLCVIGSGATAAETLKNLVLPNVGEFTIIDDAITTASDKNNNFFIDIHSLNRPRAEVVCEFLLEMNSEVKGHSLLHNTNQFIKTQHPSFFEQFSLVIIADATLSVANILPLARHLYDHGVPLIIVESKGLLGKARLQVKEHTIVESHPGNDRFDLFIHPQQRKNWPELQQYCNKFKLYRSDFAPAADSASSSVPASNLPKPDGEEHAHIPYVAILSQEIDRWISTHSGNLPRTFDEKKEFKEFVRSTAWSADEGNFDEAIQFAYRAYDLPQFDSFVQKVFDDNRTSDDSLQRLSKSVHANSSSKTASSSMQLLKYWLMVRAIKEFIQQEGHGTNYPVTNSLPDMHCKTAYYVELKNLFEARAQRDLQAIQAHISNIEQQLKLASAKPSDEELEIFVKNIRTLRVIRTRSLEEEYLFDSIIAAGTGNLSEEQKTSIANAFPLDYVRELLEDALYAAEDEDDSGAAAAADSDDMSDADGSAKAKANKIPNNIYWYLGMRAATAFHNRFQRVAGVPPPGNAAGSVAHLEADVKELGSIYSELIAAVKLDGVLEELGQSIEPPWGVLQEIVRSANCEPHVTAAFMGGIASQVALKILLQQYVPINHTLLWNGVVASSSTLQM